MTREIQNALKLDLEVEMSEKIIESQILLDELYVLVVDGEYETIRSKIGLVN